MPAALSAPVSLEFFRRQDVILPELCFIASAAVGFPVAVYRVEMDEAPEFQVMRWDEGPGPGKEFWDWYSDHRPQFHSTPTNAAAAFVAGWHEWQSRPEGRPFR